MSSNTLVYASTNRDKVREATVVLARLGIAVSDLACAAQTAGLQGVPEVLEPSLRYEENAAGKALGYARLLERACLADDTGIEIEQLGWLPGVYTARFGFERVAKSLQAGRGYRARFVCCAAYAEPAGRVVCVTEYVHGRLVFPQGVQKPMSSLPYGFFFTPDGESESLARLMLHTPEFLSHRGRALTQMCRVLNFPGAYRG